MQTWNKLKIDNSLIAHKTEKSVLIRMPDTSKFAGMSFWHPIKLFRDGAINYTDNFIFSLFRKEKSNGVYVTVSQVDITHDELENAFSEPELEYTPVEIDPDDLPFY